MEERRVADYFVVAGLPPNPEPLEDFSSEGISFKSNYNQPPITDIAVIFRNLDESPPPGFNVIDTTVSGLCADLNHGSIRSPNVFLCYRRGRDKPPLVDIGVLYEGKERVLADSDVIYFTPNGRPANVNNSGSKTYITFRRASETAPCNELVVMDICVTLTNKGEVPPHTFCTIPKNLNKGMVGSDVYLCYKKSMNKANSIAYKPAVLEQFPIVQHEDFVLPPSVPLFCLPMGATIECWPVKARPPEPVFSTFVLTSHSVEKVYGAAVTFYEKYSTSNNLTSEQKQLLRWDSNNENKSLNINKCICILSRWPFFDTFEKFLLFLYKTSINGSQNIPIERYISHFMLEVPFPSPQRPRILIQLNNTERLSLAQPEDSPLSLSGASFQHLLKNLSADDCLLLLLFALTEQKILIHSLRPNVLTSVAEAVSMMIFPFHWQCPYIPLCPLGLSDVLSAPMAFIVGVDSRYFDLYDPPNDITCVDLDTNTISVAEEKKFITIKLLPKKPARTLRTTIISIMERMKRLDNRAKQQQNMQTQQFENQTIETDFKLKKAERAIELDIQEAFLRFTASVLKGFRSFLQPITKAPTIGATDCSSLFDIQGFLKSRDKAYQRFYSLLVKTQMFCRFIEERSFVSDKDIGLAFFDECTEKVDNEFPEKESRLLEREESHQSERTVFILPPEPIGLAADVMYTYSGFGNLNQSLYHEKALVKTWVSPLTKCLPMPGSPLAKRTKQEIKSARQIAKRHSEKPILWSKCLVSYCYTLWFIHLPAFVQSCSSKSKALQTAYEILVNLQSVGLHPLDEICYRVLMQLCGQYSQPVLAVKLLNEMKRNGIQPNAITYGFYNKAVYESTWPASNTNAYLLWNKLRNVIIGVALLKRGSRLRPTSLCSESDYEGSTDGGSAADISLPTTEVKHEDGASTGCQSDVGYNSMNTDETQKSSSSISSQLTTNEGENSVVVESFSKPALKDSNAGSRVKKVNRMLRFEDIDFTESDHLRSQLRTIVRSSISSLGSTIKRSRDIVDSSAGVLMTGCTSMYYDEEFGNAIGLRWRKKHHRPLARYRARHRGGGPDSVLTLPNRFNHDDNEEMLRSDSFGNDAQILSSLNRTELDDGVVKTTTPQRKKSIYDGPKFVLQDELLDSNVDELSESPVTMLTSIKTENSWFDLDSLKNNLKARAGSVRDNFPKASKVTRSATFCHSPEHTSKLNAADEAEEQVRRIHRSSSSALTEGQTCLAQRTVSASSLMSPPFSGLASLKFAFNQSPRKSDILGSLKSAANSMACRLSEIKEAISTSTTPTKTSASPYAEKKNCSEQDATELIDIRQRMSIDCPKPSIKSELVPDEIDAMLNEAKRVRSLSVESAPCVEFQTSINDKYVQSKLPSSVAMEILMSTCSRCHTCGCVLYDEEIMSNWTAEDSNLNTRCQFCDNKLVPFLVVTIRDYRVTNEKLSEECIQSATSLPNIEKLSQVQLENASSSESNSSSSLSGSPPKTPGEEHEQSNSISVCRHKSEKVVVRTNSRKLCVVPEIAEDVVVETNDLGSAETNDSLASSRASSVADVTTRGHSTRESLSPSFISLESISVPYLSPIVLRKEMENVLDHEGDACLNEARFVDEHPIIYWNLIWFFERIRVPSHITGLCLSARSVNRDRDIPLNWIVADSNNIVVRCLWDNVKLHEEIGQPMYILWNQNIPPSRLLHALLTEEKMVTKDLMQQILINISHNDLTEAVRLVLTNIQKKQAPVAILGHRLSVYRDILFLIVTAIGRENISLSSLEREYRIAYEKLLPLFGHVFQKFDQPPSVGAVLCRQTFRSLEL